MSSVSLNQAQQFLRNHLSAEPQQLRLIGEGAWSRCFGYHVEDQEYAIRFGRYIEDFQKDRWVARFSSAQLSIPEVFEVGEGLSGYYRMITKHGDYVWLQTRATMMFDSHTGEPSYIVCMNFVIR